MTYVSWAAYYEGESDRAYFDLLIPKVVEELIITRGTRNSTIPPIPSVRVPRGSVDEVAREACKSREAFHLIFFHADTGGRGLEASLSQRSAQYCEAMQTTCEWPLSRCITISPRHEVEAWVLADPMAVTGALGYSGSHLLLGLPNNAKEAERLVDPKSVLAKAIGQVRGRRKPYDARQIFPAIAQRQNFANLRQAQSFAVFEASVASALADLGCI